MKWLITLIALVAGVWSTPYIPDLDLHYYLPYPKTPIPSPTPTIQTMAAPPLPTPQSPADYQGRDWFQIGQDGLMEQLEKKQLNTNDAKNIVLFLGDGLSTPTYMATRWYMGGADKHLTYDKFPYFGLSKTYSNDRTVPDSACTSTAYTCGVKANLGTIGVNDKVLFNECYNGANTNNHVYSIAKWAQDAGKSTGFITTTTVTHASPSGLYAHTANRMWEDDTMVRNSGCDPSINHDIARQLIESDVGKKFNVILGGGRQHFMPSNYVDAEGFAGSRTDQRNLIDDWLAAHPTGAYVRNTAELVSTPAADYDHLLGLFYESVFPFNYTIASDKPCLNQMVAKALEILKKNKKGFFLFVEGGLIDFAHHYNTPQIAFQENAEYSRAMGTVRSGTDSWDTLIVATSDHSHTMSVSGYPEHGVNIFGAAEGEGGLMGDLMGQDNLPYSILSYANGPGYARQRDGTRRADLRLQSTMDMLYQPPSIADLTSETHGGDDVGIFASGPYAHLFTGVLEQHYIPHAMAYAANIGNGRKANPYI